MFKKILVLALVGCGTMVFASRNAVAQGGHHHHNHHHHNHGGGQAAALAYQQLLLQQALINQARYGAYYGGYSAYQPYCGTVNVYRSGPPMDSFYGSGFTNPRTYSSAYMGFSTPVPFDGYRSGTGFGGSGVSLRIGF